MAHQAEIPSSPHEESEESTTPLESQTPPRSERVRYSVKLAALEAAFYERTGNRPLFTRSLIEHATVQRERIRNGEPCYTLYDIHRNASEHATHRRRKRNGELSYSFPDSHSAGWQIGYVLHSAFVLVLRSNIYNSNDLMINYTPYQYMSEFSDPAPYAISIKAVNASKHREFALDDALLMLEERKQVWEASAECQKLIAGVRKGENFSRITKIIGFGLGSLNSHLCNDDIHRYLCQHVLGQHLAACTVAQGITKASRTRCGVNQDTCICSGSSLYTERQARPVAFESSDYHSR
jgi:hypothetical protein